MRAAVRVISICTTIAVIGLILFNRPYVAAYDTALGQVFLAGIATCWGFALWWLAAMSRPQHPERFLITTGAGR